MTANYIGQGPPMLTPCYWISFGGNFSLDGKVAIKTCTVSHIFNPFQETENQAWAESGTLTFRSVWWSPWEELVKLHWLGVATSANCVEIRGREKSQFFFQLKDQSLICKCVFQQCSTAGDQQKGDLIKFLSIKFHLLYLIVVDLEVFLRVFFVAWFGREKQGTAFCFLKLIQCKL